MRKRIPAKRDRREILSTSLGGKGGIPFSAIVGQQDAKLALILCLIAPELGGVVLQGPAGTGKSVLARSIRSILPDDAGEPKTSNESLHPVFIEIPLGVRVDRLLGGIDIGSTLKTGAPVFSQGLLVAANQGILCLDHVNLLSPAILSHVASAMDQGYLVIERDGFSLRNWARFIVIATMNDKKGELSPVLRERVGLIVEMNTLSSPEERAQLMQIATRSDRHGDQLWNSYRGQDADLSFKIATARLEFTKVMPTRSDIERVSETALELGISGNKADIHAVLAASACAALSGRTYLNEDDLALAVRLVLLPRATTLPAFDEGQPDAPQDNFSNSETSATGADTGDNHGSTRSRPELVNHAEGQMPETDLRQAEISPRNRAAAAESNDISAGSTVASLIAKALSSPLPPGLSALIGSGNGFGIPRTGAYSPSGRKGEAAPSNHGRYAGAELRYDRHRAGTVAVDATLRAAAPYQITRRNQRGKVSVDRRTPLSSEKRRARPSRNEIILKAADLRFKQYKQKRGTLFIFAIDASGSMAMGRIGQAKGAVISLLQRSYLNRDSVSVISFGGDSADVLLPPTRSVARARKSIELLPAGGGTPISAGVLQALSIAQSARRKLARRVILVILTDGRANVPMFRRIESQGSGDTARQSLISEELKQLGRVLLKETVTTVIIDTGSQFVSRGDAISLSGLLGAKYVYLPRPNSQAIYESLKNISQEGGSKSS